MGKAAKAIAVCVLALLLNACSVEPNISFSENPSPTVNQEKIQQPIMQPYNGQKLSAGPVSAAKFYYESFTENVSTQAPVYEVTDYIAVAEEWTNSWYLADSFTEKYRSCDRVEAYPILGTYLERTDQIAYLFYEGSIPVGISILTIDEQGTPVEASPYKDMTVKPTVVVPLSAEECFLKIEKCLNKYPEFEIMGIVGDTNGYPNMYPVGKQSGKETIQFMYGELMDFKLVEPFKTLEEGRAAFSAYHAEKQKILSELTLYPWVDAACYYGGYLGEFKNSAEYITAQKTGTFTYLEEYDSVIAVPLLSEDLQENEYILHLLYYHNQLIAELVLQRTSDGKTVAPVWENVADKTPDGKYIPINTSTYVRVLEQVATKNISWENQGVVFSNGQFCPIGLSDGSLMIYNTNTDATTSAD